ncbi:MAG: DUF2914 domain-containing protein, partial [Bdellovibrionales bacterium]|nr:DUF2914 domain-containing protein [Bdellovibrionales bacterium]
VKPGGFWARLWKYHVELLHFLFGSLLSLYTIFYFKSSSLMSSFIFMFLLASLLVINEWPRFQKLGHSIRFAILALCITSYLIYLAPVATGSIGVGIFLLALAVSIAIYLLLFQAILRVHPNPEGIFVKILLPGLLVNLVLAGLYFTKILPPVPLSLKHIGIYHNITKQNGHFVLSYERDWWRFWQSGAQTFIRREGDQIHCFVSIFSPTAFREQVKLIWLRKGNEGWQKWDSISLPIVGGRDEGYRGYAQKSNFETGSWQVRVVTSDDRELGRIYFDVVDAESSRQRKWRQDTF